MSVELDLTDLETYIDTAEQHGEMEHLDYEIGDLVAMLREVWEQLPALQRASVLESDSFAAVLETGSVPDGTDLQDIETYIDAARRHGEDGELDHEAGDLQDMLREAWELLPAMQRASALESFAFRNTIEAVHDDAYDDLDEDEDDPDHDL